MEVSKACLMRRAVSGQRPGSLMALQESKLTWRERKGVLHSSKFKLVQTTPDLSHVRDFIYER